jgi:hypothetical protein
MRYLMLALPLALMAAGCSSEPRAYPVRGKVVMRGKPVRNVKVFLHPLEGADATVIRPQGTTDEAGEFRLTSRRLNDGAEVGEYAVTLFWPESGDDSPDRLKNRFSNRDRPLARVKVEAKDNVLEPFRLPD